MRAIPSTVAVLGGRGMLGRAWCEQLSRLGVSYISLDLPELDIRDAESIAGGVPSEVDLVVNCAAWTDVDGAESHEAEAERLNADAVKLLADYCVQVSASLIHYSTDYVFDGESSVPYRVDHPISPVNAYGRTKARGEAILRSTGNHWLILRTSWLYAPWGRNFVRTIAGLCTEASEGESPRVLRVVNDQRGRPTSAEHLASVSLRLYQASAAGIYHVTDGGECTWYDLAVMIAEELGTGSRIEPCGSAFYPRPARRPAYSVLDLSDTERLVGEMPSWRSHVSDVLSRMEPIRV